MSSPLPSPERLAHAVRSAGIGLWQFDPRSGRHTWDEQMYSIMGWPRGSEPPSSEAFRRNLVLPDDHERHRQARDEVEAGADVNEIEYRIRTPQGEVRHLLSRRIAERDANGRLQRVFGATLDISELRNAQAAALAAAERESFAAEAVGIGVWELDVGSGQIHWNGPMWRLYGRKPGSVRNLAQEWPAFIHEDDRVDALREALRAIEIADSYENQVRVRHPDGQLRVIAHRSRIERDGEGRAVRQLGVAWDVTESRLAAAAEHARAAADRTSRAKTEFLSRLSHDLRTPLNAILGNAELILLDPESGLSEAVRERLELIQKAGWHLLEQFEEVLDMSQIESGALKLRTSLVPVAPLIEEVLAWLRDSAQARGIALGVSHEADAPAHVWADRKRLAQALSNLVSNAIKYNRPGGTLEIKVQSRGSLAVISVRDQGHGLSAAQLEALFTPWSRLGLEASPIEGRGMGLAIALQLIEAMQGRLDVASEPGVGSEFRISLRAGLNEAIVEPGDRFAPRDDLGGTVLMVTSDAACHEEITALLRCRPRVQLMRAEDAQSAAVLAAVVQPELVVLAEDAGLAEATLAALSATPETRALACLRVQEARDALRPLAGEPEPVLLGAQARLLLERIDAHLARR